MQGGQGGRLPQCFHAQSNLTFYYYSSLERDTENAGSLHRVSIYVPHQHFLPTLPQLQCDHQASRRILHPFALLPWNQD